MTMDEPTVRLRRSMLYTPGTRGDRVQKALDKGAADMVVADLEDAVAPDEKASARETVRDALLEAQDVTPERCVRINALGGPWALEDLAVVMAARPDVVVVPKAERAAHLRALDAVIATHEARHGIVRGATRLVAIVETAAGVLDAAAVARSTPRLVALAFGAEDLAADAGLRRSRGNTEVAYARSHVALAAAAAGIDAIDQVFVDIDDTDGIAEEARAARSLGYSGKMVIHPKQVAPVHEAFSPTEDEIAHARRLVATVDEEGTGAGGVLRFEGRMIDVPLIEQARRTLAEARAAGRLD